VFGVKPQVIANSSAACCGLCFDEHPTADAVTAGASRVSLGRSRGRLALPGSGMQLVSHCRVSECNWSRTAGFRNVTA
jgi:hypothetical protein